MAQSEQESVAHMHCNSLLQVPRQSLSNLDLLFHLDPLLRSSLKQSVGHLGRSMNVVIDIRQCITRFVKGLRLRLDGLGHQRLVLKLLVLRELSQSIAI
jgi:hypothetical protein